MPDLRNLRVSPPDAAASARELTPCPARPEKERRRGRPAEELREHRRKLERELARRQIQQKPKIVPTKKRT
jgi:hypothetical protein